jgi:WD40 repeat protein
MRLWDPWTGRQLVSIVGANSNSEMPIQFSPDDRRLAYAINGDNLGLFEIETAREFRSLQGHAKLGEGNYAWMDTHSRLPLLAAGTRYGANTGIRDGIHLWNLDTGRKLDFLPVGETRGLSFHPSGAVLFTGQQEGAFAWPFTAAPLTPLSHGERGNVWRLGPPHRFLEGPAGHISLNKNARRMSVVGARDVVMDLPEPPALPLPEPPAWVPGNLLRSLSDRLSRRVTLSQGGGLIVLSPDGRWAVGSSAHDASIPVWDAQTGKQIRSLSAAGWTSAEFSPDGRWLLVGIMNGYVLYEVGSLPPDSWRLRYQLPRNVGGDVHGAFAWSPDSRFFAVMLAGSVVRFVEPETGRELANLEPPDPDWAIPQRLRFSADGSMLIVSTDELRMIHVWDLRLIGARLAELGLPWDLPRFRRASSDVDAGRFRVEVHLGDFAGREQRK